MLLAGLCVAAVARPSAAEERVTVPAPLGQQNKEAVVQPGATLKQASCGWVLQGQPAQRSSRTTTTTRTGASSPSAGGFGESAYVPPPSRSRSGPTGPAIVDAAFLTLRGTVTGWDKGISITILDRNGRSRTVPLVRGASVCEGLRTGELVSLRVPLDESGALGPAERVERQAAAPAPMTSKFSQAQAPLR
jgi:hypothetical protein